MNAQKKNNAVAKKPYCKVCHDAGKSEKEYTSHFVRSELGPKGKVVCPTLLNLECRYCFKKGHTVTFCEVLKNNKKEDIRREVANNKVSEKKPVAPKKQSNSFGALNQDSDEEEEPKKQVVEEFPALCQLAPKVVEVKPVAISYAAQAAKIAAPKPKAVLEKPVLARQTTVAMIVENNRVFKKSWADWTDSEDDDDYEEQEEVDW